MIFFFCMRAHLTVVVMIIKHEVHTNRKVLGLKQIIYFFQRRNEKHHYLVHGHSSNPCDIWLFKITFLKNYTSQNVSSFPFRKNTTSCERTCTKLSWTQTFWQECTIILLVEFYFYERFLSLAVCVTTYNLIASLYTFIRNRRVWYESVESYVGVVEVKNYSLCQMHIYTHNKKKKAVGQAQP